MARHGRSFIYKTLLNKFNVYFSQFTLRIQTAISQIIATTTQPQSGKTTIASGIKLQVPIEMADVALASTTGASTWEQTKTSLDTNDYDGNPTYNFEIVVSNGTTNATYTVAIVDSAGAVKATITLDAGSAGVYNNPKRYRTSFTPNNGSDSYRVKTGATTNIDEVEVYAARMIVTQDSSVTKTRIQIPLANHANDLPGSSTTTILDSTTSSSFGQPVTDNYGIFLLTLGNFATISGSNPYSLETVMSSDGTSVIAAALFNKTDNTEVTNSEQSISSSSLTNTVTNWSSDSNFIDAKEFELRIKRTSGSGTPQLHKAAFYIRLIKLTSADLYWRVGKRIQNTSSYDNTRQRVLYDSSKYLNPIADYEATVRQQTAGTNNTELIDSITQDLGTGSASNVSIISNTSSKTRVRNTGITLTSGDRFYNKVNVTSGEADTANAFILIHTTATPPTIKTQSGLSRITAVTKQILSGLSRITQITKQFQSGLSRITITTKQIQNAISRITAVTKQFQTGVARITAITKQFQSGLTRITITTKQFQAGISRITATTKQIQNGLSRITATTKQIQNGLSRITAITKQIQLGLARVTITTIQIQSGITNIGFLRQKFQTAISRITATTIQIQNGLSRITVITKQFQNGLARITITTKQVQTAISRITATTIKTIAGLSRITATTKQFQTGLSRMTVITKKFQSGLSRITITTKQIQSALSRITATTIQTIAGKGDIKNVTLQMQQGKSRITIITKQFLSGLSRITIATKQIQNGLSRITATTKQIQSAISRITAITIRIQNGLARITAKTINIIQGLSRITISQIRIIGGKANLFFKTIQTQAGKANMVSNTIRTQSGTTRIKSAFGIYQRRSHISIWLGKLFNNSGELYNEV
jgi:hypothetical protein